MCAPGYSTENLKGFWGIPDLSNTNCTIKHMVEENKYF